MAIKSYDVVRNGTKRKLWYIDTYLTFPGGVERRKQKRAIPTRELAVALEAKWKAAAFEGRYFDRRKECKLTVKALWERYRPVSEREHKAHRSAGSHAKPLLRLLGRHRVASLTVEDVVRYREARFGETTRRGAAPSHATLDREVELLKRICNWAVKAKLLETNPIAQATLLDPGNKRNVRRVVIDEQAFAKVLTAAGPLFRPILLLAYDTGMRPREVFDLRRDQLDLKAGAIRLTPADTKEEGHKVIFLTDRVLAALRAHPQRLHCPWVFPNPTTGKPWVNIRRRWRSWCKAAGLEGAWFRDQRRSFLTAGARQGIPEKVLMSMSGHKTREVFERYHIVEEQDLKEAVRRLNMTRCNGEDLERAAEGE